MRTGQLQAHLPTLSDAVPETPRWAEEAMRRKANAEHTGNGGLVPASQVEADHARLVGLLEAERDRSPLPEAPTAEPALHDLVVRQRLGERGSPEC